MADKPKDQARDVQKEKEQKKVSKGQQQKGDIEPETQHEEKKAAQKSE